MGSRKRVIVLQHSREVGPWSYIAVTGARELSHGSGEEEATPACHRGSR